MTTPLSDCGAVRVSPPMTPERWRMVDAVLQAALVCERDRRDAFIADACGDDDVVRQEVTSLLAVHDAMTNDFLERPAIEAFGVPPTTLPRNETAPEALAEALAGKYSIEREIARGGMATVYLARDLRHDRRVAIKVLRDAIAAAVGAERFLEEIRVTALLQHPHILPLFDSGSVGSRLWYVMPFVDGETLRSRLEREGRLPVDEAVRLAGEIADALEHAHARGIVHRDVKPENVLLQGGHAVVADFGIALALENAGGERLTRTGLTLGTPQYMSPEQASGERAIDTRVDVYALGAVLHEMLAGDPPFAGGSRQVVLQRMLHEPAPPLIARCPLIPPSIDRAVQRALAKLPDERFPSAAAFAAALVMPAAGSDLRSETSGAGSREIRGRVVSPSSRRVVPARVAVYTAIGGIALGLLGGWALARSSGNDGSRVANDPPLLPKPAIMSTDRTTRNARVPALGVSNEGLALVVLDRAGRPQRAIAANRPWTPRFSPNGRRVAFGAFGEGRTTSDLWVTDLESGNTRRLTDDDGDSNDPQWSSNGTVLAYSVSAEGGKDLAARQLSGGAPRALAVRGGTQFPSDWLRDGTALIVTDEAGPRGHDILVQPSDGSPAWPYLATEADERAARVSPDGHWIAYVSNESGRDEVYLDSYPRPKHRLTISQSGGVDPVWRGDGRELYYWRGDALIAVPIDSRAKNGQPTFGAEAVLFRAPYQASVNTMYDVSPDGEQFVIVRSQRS